MTEILYFLGDFILRPLSKVSLWTPLPSSVCVSVCRFLSIHSVISASEQLSYLHWLPVHYRIQLKIATLTYKTLATCQPSYLYNLLQVHQPLWTLRSSTQKLLSTDFSRRAFIYSSPARWNSVPTSIKNCSSLYSFRIYMGWKDDI